MREKGESQKWDTVSRQARLSHGNSQGGKTILIKEQWGKWQRNSSWHPPSSLSTSASNTMILANHKLKAISRCHLLCLLYVVPDLLKITENKYFIQCFQERPLKKWGDISILPHIPSPHRLVCRLWPGRIKYPALQADCTHHLPCSNRPITLWQMITFIWQEVFLPELC